MTSVMVKNNMNVMEVVVDGRFHGPPGMGNGGYSAGLLAEQFVDGPVEITLKRPIPLDTSLSLERWAGGPVLLQQNGTILAEALTANLEIDVPIPPAYGEAVLARQAFGGFKEHPFPTCFVCGPQHDDGLHIFPGPIDGRALVAAPWTPHQALADDSGLVLPRYLWAALDCPGGIAVSTGAQPIVLGRITGEILGRLRVGERCVVIGWEMGRNGRKRFAGTAVFSETGQLIGRAKAIWFEI
jgi:hypothetical protein